jgi:uncharacterized sulfatase
MWSKKQGWNRGWGASFLLVFAGLLAGEGNVHAADAAPPNVVFIISDDHAWTDYSFAKHPHIQTPTLDKLASESLLYRRGYVPASLCRASLATILTGLYPHQHKITSNDPPLPAGKSGAAANKDAGFLAARQEMIANIDKSPTLPRMLSERGYLSFQTGKWWEGDYKRGGFTHGMSLGGRHGDQGLEIGRKTMQPMYDFVDRALAEKKPFFLWYAPMLPHSPHTPPERLLAKYRGVAPTLEIAKYWACVEWFDQTCGELLKFLDDRKLRENTLVVYLADNGWIQDPQADRYAPKSKQSQYDGGLRTPIMLRWPGKIEPRVSDELASSIDLAPTILAAADLKPMNQMQGINLLDASAVKNRERLFGECFEHNAVDIHEPATSLKYRWCIEGDWKLIVPNPARIKNGAVELYDLKADPHEERNLAGEKPDIVARLQKRIDAWWPAR